MRILWNCLSDPGLHLLGLTILLAGLAYGLGSRTPSAESPLIICATCHAHYYSESSCECSRWPRIAHARR